MQRVRVGMTGLASVVVLIGLAAAIWSSASREAPIDAAGSSNAAAVANMTVADIPSLDDAVESEPLAELGAAPSAAAEMNAADIERALNVYDRAVGDTGTSDR